MQRTRSRIATVALLLLVASSPAAVGTDSAPAASPQWSIVASANASAHDNFLAGTTCTSPTNCWAVGSSQTSRNSNALFEHWNGQKWSLTPNPAVPGEDLLNGVSCITSTHCFAVGRHGGGEQWEALIEHWNGTKWSVSPSPSPGWDGKAITGWDDVHCSSALMCMAVGSSYEQATGRSKTITARWNGAQWSAVPSPSPKGSATLYGVSCTGPKNCVAVGDYSYPYVNSPLVERWNGQKWSVVPSPYPTGAKRSGLRDVACTSATRCIAVGWRVPGHGFGGLTERWNGKKWTIVTRPELAGSDRSTLYGISCASATDCVAVGDNRTTAHRRMVIKTLIQHWNGKAWTVVASKNPSETAQAYGVSCSSAARCMAVGYAYSSDFAKYRTLALQFS